MKSTMINAMLIVIGISAPVAAATATYQPVGWSSAHASAKQTASDVSSQTIQLPEQLIVSSLPKASPKPTVAVDKPVARPVCYTQSLERFNGGKVRVCDPVVRSSNARTATDLAVLTH